MHDSRPFLVSPTPGRRRRVAGLTFVLALSVAFAAPASAQAPGERRCTASGAVEAFICNGSRLLPLCRWRLEAEAACVEAADRPAQSAPIVTPPAPRPPIEPGPASTVQPPPPPPPPGEAADAPAPPTDPQSTDTPSSEPETPEGEPS